MVTIFCGYQCLIFTRKHQLLCWLQLQARSCYTNLALFLSQMESNTIQLAAIADNVQYPIKKFTEKISFFITRHTIQPEISVGIKFGSWVPNCHRRCIGGFKFGGSVWDCHTHYMQVRNFGAFQFGSCSGSPPNCQIEFPAKFSSYMVCQI